MRLLSIPSLAAVMRNNMPEGEPLEQKSISRGVRNAQKSVEARNYEMRKNVLKYDDVMNKQRTVVYKERMEVLKGADIAADVQEFIKSVINSYIHSSPRGTEQGWTAGITRGHRVCGRL